ncbi:sensor histidine kinase [Spirilliplanes yamanashiensis]|uniref:histidine kinase n=1 Tax=Spirilliplanes yamanashiensis TaxID=42233 RepID=A0A8J3Y9U3_9ACTN|nr:sensor histidine kinase [Spirilliplanes yamanashiensis]MDP9815594.1 signal transduction histidine kinase [Spirilliplanes yamanashiensis]GIJ03848.1 two-component sensor histidine kinase [Spirilliplanes yamanashiensis]
MRAPRTRRQWLVAGCAAGLVWAVVAVAEMNGSKVPDGPGPHEIGVALLLFACFPLAAVYPVAAMVLSVLTVPYIAAVGLPGVGGSQLIAELILVAYAGYRGPARRVAIACVAAAVVPAAALMATGETSWEFVFFGVLVAFGWALGTLLRREERRSGQLAALAAELAAEREARARAAVDEERARISRELHDAVAHTVSVMTMQAGVLRRRLSDRPVERDALAQVEELGRQSVDEIRRVVGLLRPDAADGLGPAPSLRRVGELVDNVRSAGLDVTLTVDGEPAALPPGLDMSAYRVTQEALTNVLKHAAARTATVAVTYAPKEVAVRVTDDGRGAAPGGRPGHGLVGMRERVGLFGGTLRTGAPAGGGFEVYATFPLQEAR